MCQPESSCAFSSPQKWTDPRTPVKKAPIRVIFLSVLSAATVEAHPMSAPACQALWEMAEFAKVQQGEGKEL